MIICQTIEDFRAARGALQGTVAFVPTMGALHEGHLSLMRRAGQEAEHVIVSIFVNPTQFGPNEDFDAYPRILDTDAKLCESVGVEIVFAPVVDSMYPDGEATRVTVANMGDYLCGAHREGHFDGVTTIVTKLFNVVQPDVAVFGQKDYQQLAIIRRMTRDLLLPITIIGQPTVREDDGLAMSSRNRYLNDAQRALGANLSRGLVLSWSAWQNGERDATALLQPIEAIFEGLEGTRVDYIEAVDPDTLHPKARFDDGAVVALAVWVGQARLIDNIRLDSPLPDGLKHLLHS